MLPAILVLLGKVWKYAPFSCHSGLMNILIVSPPQDMILVPDNFLDTFLHLLQVYKSCKGIFQKYTVWHQRHVLLRRADGNSLYLHPTAPSAMMEMTQL